MTKMKISDFIAMRLVQANCHHVFGIPGTSCSDFFEAIDRQDELVYILTTNEQEAGYMADGYGRQGVLGAVCVSYGVGTLSMANAVASAFTERTPLIIINGGPKASDIENERKYGVLFSHSTGRENNDYEVMKQLCVDACLLTDFQHAANAIDTLIDTALAQNGPVYLEIPADKWEESIEFDQSPSKSEQHNTSDCAEKIINELSIRLQKAERPVVIVGNEVEKLGLQGTLLKWLEENQILFVTTLLSKANVYPENHALFGGVYDSDLAPKPVRRLVEEADLVIAFGVIFGIDHLVMVKKQISCLISVAFGTGRIGENVIPHLGTASVLERLSDVECSATRDSKFLPQQKPSFRERRQVLSEQLSRKGAEDTLNFEYVFDTVSNQIQNINEPVLLGIDTCLASYPAADIPMPENSRYLANPVWLAIGHGTPASVGAYFATGRRPIIITGDGGFQMVAQALSTMSRYKVPAIVIVLNNGTYAIEQFLIDGEFFLEHNKPALPYTVLNTWKYESLINVFGEGKGYLCTNAEEFTKAILEATSESSSPTLINAIISPKDLPAENRLYLEENG